MTASVMINRCEFCVPIHGISSRRKRQRADDGADRIGGINPADQPARILAAGRHRRERQRKTCPPQARRRQQSPTGNAPCPVAA